LNAANLFQPAGEISWEYRSARGVFLVAACEALKPSGKKHDRANIYDVVKSLLGESVADSLRAHDLPPQFLRNQHLHRGDFGGSSIKSMLTNDMFRDPSMDQILRSLSSVTQACLVAWLERKGSYTFAWAKRPTAG
jgi:hypothetical protein